MKSLPILTRRDFLRLAGLGSGALLLAACSPRWPDQLAPALPGGTTPGAPASLQPTLPTLAPAAPLEIDLRTAPGEVNILPGPATRVWQYQGQVVQGDRNAYQTLTEAYPGPILRLQRGQELRVHFRNDMPASDRQPTTIHWHGLHVPEEMDGHPRYAISGGESYEYHFKVLNRAGTYWFHPHPHGLTGPQVYYGLAGLLIVSDEEDAAAGLPSGEFDLPLVIQDRTFDQDNQLIYTPNPMTGFFGERILVNGQMHNALSVAAQPYRLRLLNGSNARIYKLAWDDHSPLTVIATDGGLLEKPVSREYITLAPGERVELWADFSAYSPGQELRLKSLAFSTGSGGMGSMMIGGSLPNGAPLEVLRVRIDRPGAADQPLPPRLSDPGFYAPQAAEKQRRIALAMQHMTHSLNGRTFVMDEVAKDEVVRLGSMETWEFANLGGGRMGMMMGGAGEPHPMHLHAVQFQVIERQVERGYQREYATLSAGFVDEGWKDTVLVLPGERVVILVKFEGFPGVYLYHCHNLEHEDSGMMRNFRIEV
ncbi:MAG: multicopper oxidase domain-containing protein [Chloroflexota bacterium]